MVTDGQGKSVTYTRGSDGQFAQPLDRMFSGLGDKKTPRESKRGEPLKADPVDEDDDDNIDFVRRVPLSSKSASSATLSSAPTLTSSPSLSSSSSSTSSSSTVPLADPHPSVRVTAYDTDTTFVVTMYVKNRQPSDVKIVFGEKSVPSATPSPSPLSFPHLLPASSRARFYAYSTNRSITRTEASSEQKRHPNRSVTRTEASAERKHQSGFVFVRDSE